MRWDDALNLLSLERTDQTQPSGAITATSSFTYDNRNRTTTIEGDALGWSPNGNLTALPFSPLASPVKVDVGAGMLTLRLPFSLDPT